MVDNLNYKRLLAIIIIAFLFGAAAYSIAQSALDTANINNVFEIVVNNTNLAPDAGVPHPPGTGERISGNIYYTNTSAIQIMLFAHANTAGQNAQINLSINGTEVLISALRPAGAAENTYTALNTIIPKNSNYSAAFTNYHHYEWREYPILAGKNGTLSINQTTIQNATCTDCVNQTQLDTKVNKSGDTMTDTIYAPVFSSPIGSEAYLTSPLGGVLRIGLNQGGSSTQIRIDLNNVLYPVQSSSDLPSVEGGIFYNTSSKCIAFHNGTVWREIC